MKHRFGEQSGFTLIELLIVMVLLGVVMLAIGDLFVAGTRASSDSQAQIEAQQNADLAISRLEFEARCASGATILNGGAGVALTLPSQCSNATGSVSWCDVSGELIRYAASSCTGTGQRYVSSVTSATFSLPTAASGDLPQLGVALTVNETRNAAEGFTLDDAITLRNAVRAS